MSLDVYIKSKKKEEDREWVANITHNMNKMAQRIFVSENKETLYDYVWRPEEMGREIDTNEMKNVLTKGICIMISKHNRTAFLYFLIRIFYVPSCSCCG